MATNIFNFDGTLLTTVADGTIDQTHASIKFPGRGYQNYGEPVLENILWVMQNFAGTGSPSRPVTGQLWYDTTAGSSILKVYNGAEWVSAGGVISRPDSPGVGANLGAFWYDTSNLQLKTWNGTTWDIVGPLGSASNTDPADISVPDHSLIESINVTAIEDELTHQVWRITVGGTVVAVISKDTQFTPQSTSVLPGFSKIYPGLNFPSTLTGVGIAEDTTLFKSTQNNIPNLDLSYDLGSSTRRFANVYTSKGIIKDRLLVNTATTSSSFNFEVNGTSKFNKTVTFGAGSTSSAPLKLTQGQLLASGSEQTGAIEFDGQNFYFTGLVGGVPTRRTPVFGADVSVSRSIFVSSTIGNDLNNGLSRTSPFKTIKAAVKSLQNTDGSWRSGYSIFVESGEYFENNPIYVPPRTSLVGDNLRRVIIRPVHDTLDIFHMDVNTYFFGMTFKDHRSPAFCVAFPCAIAEALMDPTGDKVLDIEPRWSPTGYDVGVNIPIYIEPPPLGGTQATGYATAVNGGIIELIVTNSGQNYVDVNTISVSIVNGGGGELAVFRVRTNTANKIIAIDVLDPGQNYDPATSTVLITDSSGGTGATATVSIGNGILRNFIITNQGSGYLRDAPFNFFKPLISIKPPTPALITSSPYVQNCSSITGPFDTNGKLITLVPPYPTDGVTPAGTGYGPVDSHGAGGGIRIDGEVLDDATVIRSFVADSFTQINQGGIGHLIINKGYTQFVSCFTTFSSIGYWARTGGFANISNSVIDFGDYGLVADGYYPVPYATGLVHTDYRSTVSRVNIAVSGLYNPNTEFDVFFSGGRDLLFPGSHDAQGTAKTDNTGAVVGITITDPGSGYTGDPGDPISVSFSTAELPPGGIEAQGTAVLSGIENIRLDNVDRKPQFGSGIYLDNKFYIINSVTAVTGQPTSWIIETASILYSANQGASINMHDISNISSGGLALEYVGSGITYNSLPVYGGNPIVENQVVDGEDITSQLYPGRVYYVTIDNTGNFKIGKYFGVNFIDGTVKLNAQAFELTNLIQIGPFVRNGVSVGTYANEISDDESLTHAVNPEIYDATTIPTQSAVRGHLEQIRSDVKPNLLDSNVWSLGSTTQVWKNIHSGTIYTRNANVTTGTVSTLFSTSMSTTTASVTGTATIATGVIDTATIGTANITTTNLSAVTIDTGIINTSLTVNGSMSAVSGTFTGNVSIGNLVVTGDSIVANVSRLAIEDPIIDLGTAENNAVLPGPNDGKDRGMIFHYYNNSVLPSGEAAGDNHAYLGMRNSDHALLYKLNVQPGVADLSNPVDLTGTVWGPISVGSIEANGQVSVRGSNLFVDGTLLVSGDIIGFYGSASDSRLKTNVSVIPDALSKVTAINGVTFDWTEDAKNMASHRGDNDLGVIAQEVEAVFPEVVVTRPDGYKAVHYEKLIPLLIQAIKELDEKVKRLENRS